MGDAQEMKWCWFIFHCLFKDESDKVYGEIGEVLDVDFMMSVDEVVVEHGMMSQSHIGWCITTNIMANIGSAFLGDLQAQRIRQLASPSSSPPSSPPPHSSFSQVLSVPPPPQDVLPPTPLTRINIDPELALELRIRWLEALIHGPDPGRKRKETVGTTLARLTEDVKKRLDAIVEPNDSLKKFIDTCMSLLGSSIPHY